MPAQEKLEWVTPKISLMGAGDTNGKFQLGGEGALGPGGTDLCAMGMCPGPS